MRATCGPFNYSESRWGRTTDLRRAIKARFLPFMLEKGFELDLRNMPAFMDFRKITSDRVYVCDIQWEKHGAPRFVVNFGTCGPNGVICHGKEIDAHDVTPSSASSFGRLTARPGYSLSCWFRQDHSLLRRIFSWSRLRRADDVVDELIERFSELEDYWSKGAVGRHIQFLPDRKWSKDRF
jgi:hypothetical protein